MTPDGGPPNLGSTLLSDLSTVPVMDAAVLFSGGKDSTLAGIVLAGFADVTMVCGTFGVTDAYQHARDVAQAIGFEFDTITLDRDVAQAAVNTMVADGYPATGIQRVHDHALEVIAEDEYDTIADGTRRDDRVPTVSRATARSIEDRSNVDYIAPLAGFGSESIDRLADAILEMEVGLSDVLQTADYEAELRALLASTHGNAAVSRIFPEHEQSRVTGLR